MPYQRVDSVKTTEHLFRKLDAANRAAREEAHYADTHRNDYSSKRRRELNQSKAAKRSLASVQFFRVNDEQRETWVGEWHTPVERSGLESTRQMHYSKRQTHPQNRETERESETRTAQNLRELMISRPQLRVERNPRHPGGRAEKVDPDLIRIKVVGDQPCDYCEDTLKAVLDDWHDAYPNSRIELIHKDPNQRLDPDSGLVLIAEPGRKFGPADPTTGQPTALSTYGGLGAYPAHTPFGTELVREDFTRGQHRDRDPYHPIQEPVYSLQRSMTEETYANQSSGSGSNRGHDGSSPDTFSAFSTDGGYGTPGGSSGYENSGEPVSDTEADVLSDRLASLSVVNPGVSSRPVPSPYAQDFDVPEQRTTGPEYYITQKEFDHFRDYYKKHRHEFGLKGSKAIDDAARTAAEKFARERAGVVQEQGSAGYQVGGYSAGAGSSAVPGAQSSGAQAGGSSQDAYLASLRAQNQAASAAGQRFAQTGG